MKNTFLLTLFAISSSMLSFGQTDSAKLEQIRTESGVDPTRVQSRVGYTFLINDQKANAGQITNRMTITLGVNRWSFAAKYEAVSKMTGVLR